MAPIALLAALALPFLAPVAADDPSSIALRFGLTESYTFAVPTTAMDSGKTSAWITDKWNLNDHINWGNNWIVFTPDPSLGSTPSKRAKTSTTSSPAAAQTANSGSVSQPESTDLKGQPPVLRVEYPAGSYSGATGGTQFYAQPLNATSSTKNIFPNTTSNGQFERMLLSYDVWFPTGYNFELGGKLPGLRGGSDIHGCSGGKLSDGADCFSTRLMWRTGGEGEIYAYIMPSGKNFCSQPSITCNHDYGTSLGRRTFSFQTGRWQTVWLYVGLNEQQKRNGVVALWFNGVKAFELGNLVIRNSGDIASIGGLYFSTFFGGYDSSWATETQQFSYFRNMQLWAGLGASNTTGDGLISGAGALSPSLGLGAAAFGAAVLAMGIMF